MPPFPWQTCASNTKSPIIRSLTARYKYLDETDRSQVAFDMRPVSGISHFGPPAPGSVNTPWDIHNDL